MITIMAFSITRARQAYKFIMSEPASRRPADSRYPARICRTLDIAGYATDLYKTTSRQTDKLPDYPFKLTDFERQMPFRKSSVRIYLSLIPYFFAAVYFVKDKVTHGRALASMRALVDANNGLFRDYPAHYLFDRQEEKLTFWRPDDLLLRWSYTFDLGNNVFPSQHVSFSVFCALALYHSGYRRSGNFLLLWSLLLSASILPVKQHFQADLVAGLVLATKVLRENHLKPENPMGADGIRREAAKLYQNLLSGNYSPEPEAKQDLIKEIDPQVIKSMENFRRLNPFYGIYADIIEDTLALIRRL